MNILRDVLKSLFGRNREDPELDIRDGRVAGDTHRPAPEPGQDERLGGVGYVSPTKPPENASEGKIEARLESDAPEVSAGAQKRGRPLDKERFFTHLVAAGRQPRTVQEYRYDLAWWEKQAARRRITANSLGVAVIEEMLKGLAPRTRHRKLAVLRSYAKWMLRDGSPRLRTETEKLTSPKLPKGLPRDLGNARFLELRAQARDLVDQGRREGIWIGLKIMGGLRISEIQTAQPQEKSALVVGKGAKERMIPLPQWLLTAMRTQPRQGVGGWAKGRRTIWAGLNRLGIRKPHTLRHTYAMELLRRGRSIEEIQVLLGHESIATTSIYARMQCPTGVVGDLER